LIRDADHRQELGRQARKRAETIFRWDEVTQNYEALFSEVVTKKIVTPPSK